MFPPFIGKEYSKIMPSPRPVPKQLQLHRTEHYYHQGRPWSPQTVDTSSLKVKMVEKCNLSQICCKWTIPAKPTHVTLLPLMSPDNITHCWNSVDSRKWRKKMNLLSQGSYYKRKEWLWGHFCICLHFNQQTTIWRCVNITMATL